MTGILLGLLTALGWGLGDFYGGVASRRWPSLLVILGSKGIATMMLLVVLILRSSALIWSADLAWAMLAGSIDSIALLGFYQLLSRGNMSISAPITALLATTVPVLFGIITTGLPGSVQIIGIAFALVAILLIGHSPTKPDDPNRRKVYLQILIQPIWVGIIFGSALICLDQVENPDVFAPLLTLRIAAISTLLLSFTLRPTLRRPILAIWNQKGAMRETFTAGTKLMAFIGLVDISATGAFILATQLGSLTIIAALGSLYPAVTVLLARFIDKERLHHGQLVSLVLCFMAITLISV